jgi:hypothetical protein
MTTRPHQHLAFLPGVADLLIAAGRCWRAARDGDLPVQQALHALLAPRGYGMMAPVLDSLMRLYEAALGRTLVFGKEGAPTADGSLLLGLLDGSRSRRKCIDCTAGAASALDCAICSTRIMMGLSPGG